MFEDQLINDFQVEAKEHLENIEDSFLALEKQKQDIHTETIDKIFRAVHSIKGGASFINFHKITDLSHLMETILHRIRSKEIIVDSALIDALLQGSDILLKMINNIRESNNYNIDEISARLSNFLEKKNKKKDLPEKKKNTKEEAKDLSELEPEPEETNNIDDIKYSVLGYIFDDPLVFNNHNDNIYNMQFDLSELYANHDISPVRICNDLLCMGKVIDSRLEMTSNDFNADLSKIPLYFHVLFSSQMAVDMIKAVIDLPLTKLDELNKEETRSKIEIIEEDHTTHESDKIEKNEDCKILQQKSDVQTIDSEKQKLPSESSDEISKDISDDIIKTVSDESEIKENEPAIPVLEKTEQNETIRINVNLLNKVMNLAGELVLVRNQYLLLVDNVDSRLIENSQRMDIVTSELQESIMKMRMQPVGNLFSRLPRLVRDLAKKCEKSIVIITKGNEVELDKTILESLSDPLTHIIRNCCDHGIEKPEIRVKSGKTETGYINVKAFHEAGQINIVISDDGKGIDKNAISQKLIEKGLKKEEELSQMNDKELIQFIMHPGFSTAKKATDISGRGVGMDVVKTSIEQLGGSIELFSKDGKGTSIHLRMPLTLAIIPCLIVSIGNDRFAIPEINIDELVSLYNREMYELVEANGDQEVFRLRNSLLPLVRLEEVLNIVEPFNEEIRSQITEKYRNIASQELSGNKEIEGILVFAVIKIGAQKFGLIVDKVIGTEEIVVNPIHSSVKPFNIYSGTTIMGDGTVALILDINGIAAHSGIKFTVESETIPKEIDFSSNADLHRVLVFKSGKNEQFAVPLVLMRRVEHININQIELIGEKEFISIDSVPVLVTRLEKLLSVSKCVNKEDMYLLLPKQTNHPIGILISDLIDVISLTLDLNKDSFMEEGMLGTAIIMNHITLFIDIFKLIERVETQWFGTITSNIDEQELRQNVLLVEDTNFFQRLVQGYLESSGFNVIIADNGKKALEMLESQDFDLIVSDIEMPEMDGLALVSQIKKNPKLENIPIIALTSLDSKEDHSKGLEAGFDAYEVKVDKDKLIKTINSVFEKYNS